MCLLQIHSDFIGARMQRMEMIYENLCRYEPGEIEKEPTDLQTAYNNEARNMRGFLMDSTCTCVLSLSFLE